MAYVKAEAIDQARRIDLLTYLSCCEPGNLVHISGNNYCTREHDSLKISNGKWYWFSRGIGGVSALDYLMKVKEYSLPEAVELIVGREAIMELPTKDYEFKTKPVKKLLMPELTDKPYRTKQYLRERGIHPEIIQYCIYNSLLFETAKYHNVVFVGYDKQGIAKYAAMRGTKSAYKGEVTGSDKRFSFSISETTNAEHMYFQELSEVEKYDGIWACSSILHLNHADLEEVMKKMALSVKTHGIMYTSFKYGTFSGERNGRYFTDMTEETFEALLQKIPELEIEEQWITSDVRPGRGEEKWLNLILRKN